MTHLEARSIAEGIREFRAAGGEIRMPPHHQRDREEWIAVAKSLREGYERLPAVTRTLRLKKGLIFLWGAVKCELCAVALLHGELLAVMDYELLLSASPPTLRVGSIGSRRAPGSAAGAGRAIEFEIAREALRLGLRVKGVYLPGSRTFHESIGRRLDQPRLYDSEWTAGDCRLLVRLVEEELR